MVEIPEIVKNVSVVDESTKAKEPKGARITLSVCNCYRNDRLTLIGEKAKKVAGLIGLTKQDLNVSQLAQCSPASPRSLRATSSANMTAPLPLCPHPAKQHGRLSPLVSLSTNISSLLFLVSSFLADSTQHIHSLRASGVISPYILSREELVSIVLAISLGSRCTV